VAKLALLLHLDRAEMNLSESPSLATLPGGSRIAPEQAASNLRILVVDDDPGMRTVSPRPFMRTVTRVQTANDGSSALSLHSQQPFDGVVAESVMPGMSGRELGLRSST
jgi:PleD family two-component response regulator